MSTFEVGDWVTITGRIVEFDPNTVDVGVEVFSKTDQYTAFVRRDLCAPTLKPLREEPGIGSVALLDGEAWQLVDERRWYSATTTGDVEGRTWAQLNALGDVEVIHHA